jgi:hypothetical protein
VRRRRGAHLDVCARDAFPFAISRAIRIGPSRRRAVWLDAAFDCTVRVGAAFRLGRAVWLYGALRVRGTVRVADTVRVELARRFSLTGWVYRLGVTVPKEAAGAALVL